MENDSQDGKSVEPATLTEQIPLPDTLEWTPTTPGSKAAVFLRRKPGQSFEQFKDACVASFRKAGLIKD